MVKIAVIYYSTWGHIKLLAEQVKAGLDEVEGVEAALFQIPETLPAEVLEKMHAPPKGDVPEASVDTLVEYDAFVFGIPTRFGRQAAQVSAFFDRTGGLWQKGALVGKPVSVFTSAASQGGGNETTALTSLTQFVNHGMIIVPIGYTFGEDFLAVDVARGGSPYGSGTLAGADGSRQVSDLELRVAKHQGTYFGGVAKKIAAK